MSDIFNPKLENISVIISKNEENGFNYKCENRLWDGFVFFTDGEGIFTDEYGKNFPLKKDSLILLKKGDNYSICAETFCSYIASGFDFSPSSKDFLSHLPSVIELTEKQCDKIYKIHEIWKSHSWDAHALCQIRILSLYHELYSLYVIEPSTVDSDIEKAKIYIRENHGKGFSFEELFSCLAISPSYLRSIFKKSTGQTISDYRESFRIQSASEMIESGNFNLAEVADELGYWDVYHFSKVFKRKKGISPGKYSKSNAKKQFL